MGLLLTTVEGLEEVALAEAERRGLKPGGVIRPSLLLVEGAAEEALKLKTVDSVSELLCSFESGDLGLRALRHALRECFRGISREGCSGRVRVRAWARIPGVSRRALELVAARELSRVLRVGTSPEAGPTVRIYLCSGGRILVAKQLNDEPLHLRQYYVFKHPHTLNPLIAAALPLLAPAGSLHDPCCGSGTIPIEYLLARPETLAVCSDVNSEYARRALENSRRAGTDVEVLVADLFHSPLAREVKLVAANPPRGRGAAMYIEGVLRHAARSGAKACPVTPYERAAIGTAVKMGYVLTRRLDTFQGGRRVSILLFEPS